MVAAVAELLATLSAGLFAGASVYINLVEHPARMQAGTHVALAEFAPSYHRATVTQVSGEPGLSGCAGGLEAQVRREVACRRWATCIGYPLHGPGDTSDQQATA